MSAVLDFPAIDEAAPSQGTEIAAAAAAALDLEHMDLNKLALAKFGDWRTKVDEAKKKLTGVVLDVSTPSKLDEAKSLRHREAGQPKALARKVSKGLKSKLAACSKIVGSEEEALIAGYDEVEQLLTPQIEAGEQKLAEEKAERERIAAEREAEFRKRLDVIRACVANCQGISSERISAGIAKVEAIVIDEAAWEEFAQEAANVKSTTLAAMLNLRDQAKAREDEAARLEAQRIENERIAAAQKAEAERLAAQQRTLDEQAAKIAAQQKAIDDAKAEAERKDREAAEAEARQSQEEADMRARDEQARAERDAALQRQAEEAQRVIETAARAPVAAPTPAPVTHPAAQALRNEQPTLKLGTICERLGFTVSAAFLAELGFKASMDKRACLYLESEWMEICDAISEHVISRRELLAA